MRCLSALSIQGAFRSSATRLERFSRNLNLKMTSKELDNLVKVRLLKAEHGDENEPASLLESGRNQALAPDR